MTQVEHTTTRRRSLRNTLYRLHRWAGFQLTVLTLVVMATGTFAVIADEIDWALQAERRIQPFHGEDPAWDAMFEAARQAHPDDRITQIRMGETASSAAGVLTQKPDERPRWIYVDPANGDYLGEGHWITVQRILRDLHRYLFLVVGGIGLPIVTIAAVVLAIQMVSGLVVVRRWGQAFFTLRTGKGTRVLVGDFHRLAAMWTLWFTLLMVVTSIWYFVEWSLRQLDISSEAPRHRVELAVDYSPNEGPLPGRYIQAAREAFPEMRPNSVSFPSGERGAVLVMGPSTDVLVRSRASRVYLDPADASVLHVQRPAELSVLNYIAELADPWHFGDVGGLWTKWLWFACGLVLTSLSATGTWLTWRLGRLGFGRWHALGSGVLGIAGVAGYFYLGYFLV